MWKNYRLWYKTGNWLSLLTGCIHSLNFLKKPKPANATEEQLFDLMQNYRFPLPGGFERSMGELMLFFNLNMTLFLISWGLVNLLVAKAVLASSGARTILWVNFAVWTVYLIPTYLLTFLTPLVLIAICWLFYTLALVLFLTKKSLA